MTVLTWAARGQWTLRCVGSVFVVELASAPAVSAELIAAAVAPPVKARKRKADSDEDLSDWEVEVLASASEQTTRKQTAAKRKPARVADDEVAVLHLQQAAPEAPSSPRRQASATGTGARETVHVFGLAGPASPLEKIGTTMEELEAMFLAEVVQTAAFKAPEFGLDAFIDELDAEPLVELLAADLLAVDDVLLADEQAALGNELL